MSKLLLTLFISFTAIHLSYAQITVKGRVLNAEDNTPLSYVNIGISGKNTGTVSGRNGAFELEVPDSLAHHPLKASYVGFEPAAIPIKENHKLEILLPPKPLLLQAVSVKVGQMKETKEGVKTFTPFFNAYTTGSKDDIMEVGQQIKLDKKRLYVDQVNFYLFGCNSDSISFRINFYESKDGKPGKLINKQAIFHSQKKVKGWINVDVKEYGIQAENNFFVCLEFLPTQQITEEIKVYYGVNMLRKGACYRDSSQGQWKGIGAGITLNIEGQYEKL